MLKIIARTIAFLTVAACLPLAAPNLVAQAPASSPAEYQRYKVDLKISELEKGKTVNSRSYSMVLAQGKADPNAMGQIRVGSQVEYPDNEGKPMFHNVGMNIDCKVFRLDGEHVEATTTVNSNSLPEGERGSPAKPYSVFRNLEWRGSPALVLGKPTVVSEVDDVASDHRYQIEMTVTAIK